MLYQSTRDINAKKIEGSLAIKQGLANDGGLFVPEAFIDIEWQVSGEYEGGGTFEFQLWAVAEPEQPDPEQQDQGNGE